MAVARFDVEALRLAAGEKVFERGEGYHLDGLVEILAVEPGGVVADVHGSEAYRVELGTIDGNPAGDCSCPAFSNWGFCKHLVATGLAANAMSPGEAERVASRPDAIREHLRAEGLDALVEMIIGLAERDPAVRKDLELAAAAAGTDESHLFAHFEKAITEATATHGFIEYRGAGDWTSGIDGVLDRVESILERGHADIVLRLLDLFFDEMETALGDVDDSDGEASGVVARARDIHIKACAAAKPDPIGLARDLFDREMGSDWGFFEGAFDAYHDILGKAGRAEYRRHVEDAWRDVKPLQAGEREDAFSERGNRFRLAAILDSFAEEDGDVDARIEIRAKDLSLPYSYLRIAELCLDHGREADATKWAEEGMWLFEDRPDDRLTAFTADLYRRLGRERDAEELLWRAFERHPSLDWYGRLKQSADGDPAATAVTDKAIEFLRARLAASGSDGPSWGPRPADLLVKILMAEGRLADAWAAVGARRCGDPVLESLAGESESAHPTEAIAAYSDLVERTVAGTNKPAYEKACGLIERLRAVREGLGQGAAHAAYLDDVMARHKAKRNFMKLLRARAETKSRAM